MEQESKGLRAKTIANFGLRIANFQKLRDKSKGEANCELRIADCEFRIVGTAGSRERC
jgi:hypothetical protein